MIRYFKKSFIRYLAYGLAIALLSFLFGLFKVNAATTEFLDGNVSINNNYNLPYNFNVSANGNYTTSISVMWNTNYESQWIYDKPYVLIEACTNGSYNPSNYTIVRTYAQGQSCPNSCFQQDVSYFTTEQSCPLNTGAYLGKKLYILLKAEKFSTGNNSPYFIITDSITFKSSVGYASMHTIYGVYMTDENFATQIQSATNQAQLNILTSTLHSDNQAIISAVGGLVGNISNVESSVDDVKDSIDNVNTTINNDNVSEAENKATSFFNSFSTNTHGLTSIITAPLNAISSITSATCSPLVLPLPFVDEDLTLPCMRPIYEQFFGDFMTLYDIVILGVVSYWIVVRIFSLVKDFKNPEHDEVEVMEL